MNEVEVERAAGGPARFPAVGLGVGALLLLMLGAAVFLIYGERDEDGDEAPPGPGAAAAAYLEPGGSVIGVLRVLGEPACKARLPGLEQWVYRASPAPPPPPGKAAEAGCEPAAGDLVVTVEDERIVSFIPEHGRSFEISSPADVARYRQLVRARRGTEAEEASGTGAGAGSEGGAGSEPEALPDAD